MRFKTDWVSLIVGVNLPFLLCFTLYFNLRAIFLVQAPWGGGYIWRGDLTEGFLRYRFRGLVFGGAYTRRSLFSEFYDIFYPDSCGRHLKPSLESGLKTMRFR